MSTANTAAIITPIVLCEADGQAAAPEWIQILPMGVIRANDGRGPWSLEDAEAVIEATKSRLGSVEMLVDYNHQSEHAARNGQPAPAAGWITGLEARPDGIYGRVKWTEKGGRAVAAREFRYISPVFNHDAQGRIRRIVSCALTNIPALDMTALCEFETVTTPEEKDMDNRLVAQALGIAETATEAEIIAACAEAVKARCEAQKEPDPAKYVPIAAHNEIMAELARLKKEQCEARADALVAEAKASGKLAPAMEKWAKAYAEKDADGFRVWLESAPAFNLDKEIVQGKPDGGKREGAGLGAEEKAVCEAMGLKEEDFIRELGNGKADK